MRPGSVTRSRLTRTRLAIWDCIAVFGFAVFSRKLAVTLRASVVYAEVASVRCKALTVKASSSNLNAITLTQTVTLG